MYCKVLKKEMRQHAQRETNGQPKTKLKAIKMQLNRKAVREILDTVPDKKQQSENFLCSLQGITYPTYWRRCKKNSWNREQILALGITLAELTGRAQYFTLDELTVAEAEKTDAQESAQESAQGGEAGEGGNDTEATAAAV